MTVDWRDLENFKDEGFVRDTDRIRTVKRAEGARGKARRRLKSSIRSAITEVRKALVEEMGDLAEEVLLEAQERVPVDTGDLARSGYIERDGDRWTVGFASEYAAIQHERTDFKHDDGQAKYLETALDEVAARAQQRMTEAARDALAGKAAAVKRINEKLLSRNYTWG